MKRFKILVALLIVVLLSTSAFAGTMSRLKVLKDVNGTPVSGLVYTGYIDAVVLVANVAQTYTIPTGANYLLFSGNTNFYVNIGGTATVPSATTATGAASALNPTLRSIGDATTVSIVSPSSAIVTIESFK